MWQQLNAFGRRLAEVQREQQNGQRKMIEGTSDVVNMVVGVRQAAGLQRCPKNRKKKYPLISRCVEENAMLIS